MHAGMILISTIGGYYGFYIHSWDLDFVRLEKFYKANFARAEIYPLALGACKMSIIFLYQRIFEGPRMRRVLLGTHIFNVLLSLAFFITTFFVIWPLRCNWQVDMESYCVENDFWDGSGAASAVNAALDIWLVLVPAFVVSRLQMNVGRKLSVISVLATGFLYVFKHYP